MSAANVLSDPDAKEEAVAPVFADEVVASENGVIVAQGKSAWLDWRRERAHYYGRTIGYSYAPSDDREPVGNLLVVDTFDTMDTTHPHGELVMDPRMSTRSTLFEFGKDGLIYKVQMAKVSGFWIVPDH